MTNPSNVLTEQRDTDGRPHGGQRVNWPRGETRRLTGSRVFSISLIAINLGNFPIDINCGDD